MRNPLRLAIETIATVALLTSCAQTSMTSMAAPELQGQSFKTILVIADLQDLGLRQEAENAFQTTRSELVCDPICRAGGETKFVPAYTVMFPGRSYSQTELTQILEANHIDATLVLSPTASGSSEAYIPPSYTTSCTSWAVNGGCRSVSTVQHGGVNVSKPWATFTAKLFDVRSGKNVWIATSSTGGNAFASSSTLIQSMADKTIANLRADHVVR